MTALGRRDWVPQVSEDFVLEVAGNVSGQSLDAIEARIGALTAENRAIHERDCVNLNPATNVMNPKAEAVLSAGLGARPSLGYPGDKYEMGLEAIEQIEIIAAELAAEVFGARFAEIRVPSGAIANLYAFMVAASPGDCIIAPPGMSPITARARPGFTASSAIRLRSIRSTTRSIPDGCGRMRCACGRS
jgi:glycine hydroxymethyltransferase